MLNVKGTDIIKARGHYSWLWSTLDPKTRLVIATEITKNREIVDVKAILSSLQRTGRTKPNYVVTDSLQTYKKAVRRQLGNSVMHVKTKSIAKSYTNLPIKRYHNEIREKLKSRRGLGNGKSAQVYADLLRIHHNFIRPHMGLDGITPAEAAGIKVPDKSKKYRSLINEAAEVKQRRSISCKSTSQRLQPITNTIRRRGPQIADNSAQ